MTENDNWPYDVEHQPTDTRPDPTDATTAAYRRAAARLRAARNCNMCDQDGYIGRVLCHHDPDAPARAQRGRDLVYRTMGWTDRKRGQS